MGTDTYSKPQPEKEAPPSNMDFGQAIKALKAGHRVTRTSWFGVQFIFKQIPAEIGTATIPGMTSLPQSMKDYLVGKGGIKYRDQVGVVSTLDHVITSWVPSINDIFAEDWEILD